MVLRKRESRKPPPYGRPGRDSCGSRRASRRGVRASARQRPAGRKGARWGRVSCPWCEQTLLPEAFNRLGEYLLLLQDCLYFILALILTAFGDSHRLCKSGLLSTVPIAACCLLKQPMHGSQLSIADGFSSTFECNILHIALLYLLTIHFITA